MASMNFLDRFSPRHREQLSILGRRSRLDAGQYLMRRGERGGDVYLIERGALDVVDTRARPEVVLDAVGAGDLVGEMAFIDMAPRNADVRASAATTVLLWERAPLVAALQADPELGAAVYAAIADMAIKRMRGLVARAVVGGLGAASQVNTMSQPAAVFLLAAEAREAWTGVEQQLRRGAPEAEQLVLAVDALQRVVQGWNQLRADTEDAAERLQAAAALRGALRPYLSRARTGSLAADLAEGTEGALRDHVLAGDPAGEGAFGVLLDRALLSLATAVGLRRGRSALLAALPELRDGAQVLVIDPGLDRLAAALAERCPTASFTLITGAADDRAALGRRLPGARLRVEDLARLATGAASPHHLPVDLVVIGGLVDSLPERRVASLLQWCGAQLASDGALLVAFAGPADDAAFVDHVLDWPLVRWTGSRLRELAQGEGLEVVEGDPDGLLLALRSRR